MNVRHATSAVAALLLSGAVIAVGAPTQAASVNPPIAPSSAATQAFSSVRSAALPCGGSLRSAGQEAYYRNCAPTRVKVKFDRRLGPDTCISVSAGGKLHLTDIFGFRSVRRVRHC